MFGQEVYPRRRNPPNSVFSWYHGLDFSGMLGVLGVVVVKMRVVDRVKVEADMR